MFCFKCGKEIADNSLFCSFCGENVSTVSMAGSQSGGRSEMQLDPDSEITHFGTVLSMDSVDDDEKTFIAAASSSVGESRYLVNRLLGKGGMGAVYEVHDSKLDRKIALKRLLPAISKSPAGLARFLSEARAVARLSHPNIVAIYDIGEDEEGHFISMEYVDGITLKEKCRSNGGLAEEEAVDLFRQVASGLVVAHEKGIVHRDVKPENILMTKDGIPKLTDFGLAQSLDEEALEKTGIAMGSPIYMAPEQQRDAKHVDHRADIYSLGATFYEMLTGEAPRVISLKKVPEKYRDVIDTCLQDLPEKRYEKISNLLQALVFEDVPGFAPVNIIDLDVSCPKCHTSNSPDIRFCSKCGTSLAELFTECPQCRKENRIDFNHCGGCGLDLFEYAKIVKLKEQAKDFEKKLLYPDALDCWQKILTLEKNNGTAQRGEIRVSEIQKVISKQKKLSTDFEKQQQELAGKLAEYELKATETKKTYESLSEDREISRRRIELSELFEQQASLKKNLHTVKLAKPSVFFLQSKWRKRVMSLETEIKGTKLNIVRHEKELNEFFNFEEKYNKEKTVLDNLRIKIANFETEFKFQLGLCELNVKELREGEVPSAKLNAVKQFITLLKGELAKKKAVPATTKATPAKLESDKTLPDEKLQSFTESITGIEFVWIPGGSFMMGCDVNEKGRNNNEEPLHEVYLDGFWMGTYLVTQGQWKKIMRNNPSYFRKGDNYPVEKVSLHECHKFIEKLWAKSDKEFRLPTEAEWEYACRSGGKVEKYSGSNSVDQVAWYNSNSDDSTHVVGGKMANDFGLYDMSGNVWEWCSDGYDLYYYKKKPKNNPQGPGPATFRVLRGGGYKSFPRDVRSTSRRGDKSSDRSNDQGFRLVCHAL